MSIRTLAATVLALGFLAPVGAMADDTSNNCSDEQRNKKEYVDCGFGATESTVNYGLAAPVSKGGKAGPTADFIDDFPSN